MRHNPLDRRRPLHDEPEEMGYKPPEFDWEPYIAAYSQLFLLAVAFVVWLFWGGH
jgi:hypothetical protein